MRNKEKTMVLSNRGIYLLILCVCFCLPNLLSSQDSIKVEDIQKFSYPFDIKDGVLVGKGAEIMNKAIADAHVVMLGNNTRNQQESDLDLALAKVLNKNAFKTMIMEIGPASGKIANRLSSNNDQTIEAFRKLNQEYYFEVDGTQFMPIPDLKYLGTSKLLQYAKEEGWSFDGIGVDSWVGYKMQVDELYHNLSTANQLEYKAVHQAVVDLLDKLYAEVKGQSYDDVLRLTEGMRSSEVFNKFIEDMSAFEVNADAVRYLQFSIDYWWMYGSKQAFKKNQLSNKRNKSLIKKAFEKVSFDFDDDKLFLKMWRGHLVNGVTPNGFYGVGNLLMELAAYHGHNSLNIGVIERYTLDGEKLIDALDDLPPYRQHHKPFISLGQKNNWVLIDLRPFNKEFHWGNYIRTLGMEWMMRRYDMILIPKTDSKAEINK